MTADTVLDTNANAVTTTSAFGSDAELHRLRNGILFLLRRELRNNVLADDICNETFRVVLERLKRQPLKDPAGLTAYLMQTARNLALMDRRKFERRFTQTGQQDAIDAVGSDEQNPVAILESQTRAAAVRKVLTGMRRPQDREILVRVYLYDQDKEQVCRELGIDAGHYHQTVYHARERFRSLLQRRFRRSDLYCLVLA